MRAHTQGSASRGEEVKEGRKGRRGEVKLLDLTIQKESLLDIIV